MLKMARKENHYKREILSLVILLQHATKVVRYRYAQIYATPFLYQTQQRILAWWHVLMEWPERDSLILSSIQCDSKKSE